MKLVAIIVFGICALAGVGNYYLMQTYEQRSGLAEVQKTASHYLASRDTKVLQKLVSGMDSPNLAAKTAGVLRELAPHMKGWTNEIAVYILPALARSIVASNKFSIEPSVYAMAAYIDAEPRSAVYMDVYIPQLLDYIRKSAFGGGPQAAIQILASLHPSSFTEFIPSLIQLLEGEDDPRILEMPDFSIRPDLVNLLVGIAPKEKMKAALERLIQDRNPYVAVASICALIEVGDASENICDRSARLLKSEHRSDFLRALQGIPNSGLPDCVAAGVRELNSDSDPEIRRLAQSLAIAVDPQE